MGGRNGTTYQHKQGPMDTVFGLGDGEKVAAGNMVGSVGVREGGDGRRRGGTGLNDGRRRLAHRDGHATDGTTDFAGDNGDTMEGKRVFAGCGGWGDVGRRVLGFENRSPHELSTGNGGRWGRGWVGPCMLSVDGGRASGGGHVKQNVMN